MEVLAKTFIVAEKKCLVGADRTAEGGAKLVTLKRRSRTLVIEIRRIEGVIAQELEGGAVQLVAARPRHDVDRAARADPRREIEVHRRNLELLHDLL